jgi:ASPM-SPD-2-Hydin domain-containing protein
MQPFLTAVLAPMTLPGVNRRAGLLVVVAAAALTTLVGATPAVAAGTYSVNPLDLDFGTVPIGTTAEIPVTVTNTGNTTETPNYAGGAPIDPTNFGGSQNCAGKALAPNGTCQFTYTFEPTVEGPLSSTTTIDIDGTSYPLTFKGVGAPNTPTTATTTTTAPTTATTAPGGGSGSGSGGLPGTLPGGATTTLAPNGTRATVEHDTVAPGDGESATAAGFKPGEQVSAVMQPNGQDLGSRVADDAGNAHFSWTVEDDATPGKYEFVATGLTSGTVRAEFTVAEKDDSGTSVWLIVAILAVIALIVAAIAYFVARRRRHPSPVPGSDRAAGTGPDADPGPDDPTVQL